MKLFPKLEGSNPTIDISNCIDLGPVLFTLATLLNGAKITGIKRLRIKESDRVSSMVEELNKFGANIEVFDDYVMIHKSELHSPEDILDGHNDHRIVMSLIILLTKYEGIIDGVEAINKSFPTFLDRLTEVGIKYEVK
jgi:3-phosphoshikimate 1-carboxyvinyltransferase